MLYVIFILSYRTYQVNLIYKLSSPIITLISFSLLLQTKNNTPAAQGKCVNRLLLYHFCVNLPVMILSYPVFKYMGMRSSLPLPSWYIQVLYILKLCYWSNPSLFSIIWLIKWRNIFMNIICCIT